MIIIGLTGSIGMGKSTAAKMFRRCGVPVFDADAEVHRLQGPGGALVDVIERYFPGTTSAEGVNRQALGARVFGNKPELRRLEALIHPVVARRRKAFLRRHRFRPLVVLDIPLLFESGGEKSVDFVAVVSAPAHLQRQRVMARPGMTEEKFASILKLQTSDAEKRRRADFIIPTGAGKARSFAFVKQLVRTLTDHHHKQTRAF